MMMRRTGTGSSRPMNRNVVRPLLVLLFGGALLLLLPTGIDAWSSRMIPSIMARSSAHRHRPSDGLYMMASKKKTKAKKTKSSGAVATGIKGFGSGTSSSSSSSSSSSLAAAVASGKGVIDRSKGALAFYEYCERNGAGDNLKRVALGQFRLAGNNDIDIGISLRGVVALKDIAQGEVLLDIPYEMSLNLGREGNDPTVPAFSFLNHSYGPWLQEQLQQQQSSTSSSYNAYFDQLPGPPASCALADCLGSTDFFSDEALEALQSPLIVEETLERRAKTLA
eukprot:scaffold169233_cov42-Attheya_sp.AAC.1